MLRQRHRSLCTRPIAETAKGPRQFYLTKTAYNGANVLSACAPGYHMASMWEIKDTSNLRYNTVLGFNMTDSGFGPPVFPGWIRTGYTSEHSNTAGHCNCDLWTSVSDSGFGTVVSLQSLWHLGPASTVDPWVAGTEDCASHTAVWCVQD